MKNLLVQDHLTSQYQEFLQLAQGQTFQDQAMPQIPKNHLFQDYLQITLK